MQFERTCQRQQLLLTLKPISTNLFQFLCQFHSDLRTKSCADSFCSYFCSFMVSVSTHPHHVCRESIMEAIRHLVFRGLPHSFVQTLKNSSVSTHTLHLTTSQSLLMLSLPKTIIKVVLAVDLVFKTTGRK